MLFITYLFVLCKRDFRLLLSPFFLTMFCHLNPVTYFVEAVYLLSGEQKTESRLDFFDERIISSFLPDSRLKYLLEAYRSHLVGRSAVLRKLRRAFSDRRLNWARKISFFPQICSRKCRQSRSLWQRGSWMIPSRCQIAKNSFWVSRSVCIFRK